jgi:hypothetical protein
MTSDHRVAGSSPAGCMPQRQGVMGGTGIYPSRILGHFLDTFYAAFSSHEPGIRALVVQPSLGIHQSLPPTGKEKPRFDALNSNVALPRVAVRFRP